MILIFKYFLIYLMLVFQRAKIDIFYLYLNKVGNKNCIFCEKSVKSPFFVLSRLFFWSLFGCLIKKVYLCKENIKATILSKKKQQNNYITKVLN